MNHLEHKMYTSLGPYDFDRNMNATLTGINQMIDRSAFAHIERLGLDNAFMQQKALGWVLYQKEFRIHGKLKMNTEYNLRTVITGKDKIFTYRDFYLYDKDGNEMLTASSSWILFDIENRTYVKSYPPEIESLIHSGNEVPPLPRCERINLVRDSICNEVHFNIGFLDLDSNSHLSNQALLDYIMRSIPAEIMERSSISNMRIEIKAEAFIGDTLSFMNYNAGDDILQSEICKDHTKPIAKAEIEFKPINA